MAAARLDGAISARERSRSRVRQAEDDKCTAALAAASSSVLVRVSNLAAERLILEADLELHATIAAVKEQLSVAIELPPVQQQLVLGTQVLADSTLLKELVQLSQSPKISLALTLIRVEGIRAVTGSEDGSLRFWDGLQLRDAPPHVLSGHTGAVCGVEVDWESSRALSGARDDSKLRLWSLKRGELLKELQGHTGPVYGMSVDWGAAGSDDASPQDHAKQQGARALSWGLDCTLILWNLELGRAEHVLRGPREAIYDAEVDWEKARALSWSGPHSDEHVLWVWDLARGTPVCTLIGLGGAVHSVEVSFKHDRAISWGRLQAPLLWDLIRGEPLLELGGHAQPVSGASLDWEQKWAFTWSTADSLLRLWNLAAGICTQELQGHSHGVHSAEVNWEQRRAITFGADLAVWLWNFQSGLPAHARVLGAHADTVAGVEVDWEDDRVLSWGDDGDLHLFDISEQEAKAKKLDGHSGPVYCANVDWSLQRALSWSFMDSDLLIWDLQCCNVLFRLSHGIPGPWGGGVEVDWERQCALRWSTGLNAATAWDLKKGILMRTLPGHAGGIMCAALE